MDGYEKAIAEAVATGNRSLLESATRMRESGGEGLVDLSGTGLPMVDGVEPAKLEAERPDDGKLIDLAGAVPLREDAPGDGQAVLSKMRESDAAKDAETGLIDLGALGVTVREAAFGGEDGHPAVYVQGPDTLPLLQDLFSCLPAELPNGTPNLENEIVKRMIEDIGRGHQLSVVDIGKLKELTVKHGVAIRALRASPDRQGQDYGSVPDPATGRQVTDDDRDTGLLDLTGDGVPAKVTA